jgi:hypothetical protein
MTPEVIKSYLVGLGFKVDSPGFKRFLGALGDAAKYVAKAGTAATAMGVAVEAAVVKVSKNFEDLYYASQRIHSTVENIQATDYAFTQVGGSAEGARAAMEGVASLVRSNPGGESFIRSLGIETRDANGELRDTSELMSDLGAKFRAMPYYMAKVRAGVLGIDERSLQAMIRGTDDFSDRYHAMAARVGMDQQQAAKASHDFMVQVRDLKVMLELLFMKVVVGLQSGVGPSLERMAAIFAPMLEALGRLAGRLMQWLGGLDHATGGWSTALLVLIGILAPIVALVGSTVAGIIALGVAIGLLIDDFQTWKEGGKSLIDWSAWSVEIDHVMKAVAPLMQALGDLATAVGHIGAAIIRWMGPTVANIARGALEGIAGLLHLITNAIELVVALLTGDWARAWKVTKEGAVQFAKDMKASIDKMMGKREAPAPDQRPAGKPAPAGAPANVAVIGKQIFDFFKTHGFSAAQAQGISAGISAESSFNADAKNPTSGAYGIGQWLGARKAELFRRYGNHPSLVQQLEFMAWELENSEKTAGLKLKAQSSARGALDAYVRAFMRPGDGTVGDLARGAQYLSKQSMQPVLATTNPGPSNVNVNQKTEVNIHGVTDPSAAGRSVVGAQERVNGNLVRNTKGAIR